MSQEIDPDENSKDKTSKKVIFTDQARIEGDLHGPLIVQPEIRGDVHIGDKYVQAEAKPRETQGLYGVPELPRAFTPRPEKLTPIKTELSSGETSRVGITGKTLRVELARPPWQLPWRATLMYRTNFLKGSSGSHSANNQIFSVRRPIWPICSKPMAIHFLPPQTAGTNWSDCCMVAAVCSFWMMSGRLNMPNRSIAWMPRHKPVCF
jgi:hypothetical protein